MSPPQVSATTTLDAAARESWEVVVMGAGPAGSLAARELAREGVRVLLVDRAVFPRHKVCGCCLNGAALGVLETVGLRDLPQRCGALELRAFHLASGGRLAIVPLRTGVSLSRERLDGELIKAAIAAGAEFLDDTQALIGDECSNGRCVELRRGITEFREPSREGSRWSSAASPQDDPPAGATLVTRVSTPATPESSEAKSKRAGDRRTTFGKAIVVAGGLGCRVFSQQETDSRRTSGASRVGAGAVLDDAEGNFETGAIYMACHRNGYVGIVRLEDGRLDVAAALDGIAIRQQGGIGPLIEKILRATELPLPAGVREAKWHGTARLTQRRDRVAGDHCFFIGDAAGYVEPFTGEGIAWAVATGKAVAPFVLELLTTGDLMRPSRGWTDKHREMIGRRARLCRSVSTLLRYPALVRLAVRLLARAPALARPVVKSLNATFAMD